MYGHAAEYWNSLITCNWAPFYPIKMGFLPEIIEFYVENYNQIFHTSFLNFIADVKFRHYIWRHNSSQWDDINTDR